MPPRKAAPKKATPPLASNASPLPPALAEPTDLPDSPPITTMEPISSSSSSAPRSRSSSPTPRGRKRSVPSESQISEPAPKKSKEDETEDSATDEGEPEEDEGDEDAHAATGSENEDDDEDEDQESDEELIERDEPVALQPTVPAEKKRAMQTSPLPPSATDALTQQQQQQQHPGQQAPKPNECSSCRLMVPCADGHFMRQFAPKFYATACSLAFDEQLKQLGLSFSPRFLCEVCCEDKLRAMERSSHRRGGQYTIVLARVDQSNIQVRSFLRKDTMYPTPSAWRIHQLASLLRHGALRLDWETAKKKAEAYYKKYWEPMCPPDSTETKGKIDGIPMFHLRSVPLPRADDEKAIDAYLKCQNGMRRFLALCYPDRAAIYVPLDRQQLVDYLRLLKPNSGRKSGNSPSALGSSPASSTLTGIRQRKKTGQHAIVTPDQDAIMDANFDLPLAQMLQRTYQPKPEELESYVINIIIPRFFQLKESCTWKPCLADPVSLHLSDFRLNDIGIPLVKETDPPFTGTMIIDELHREKDSLSRDVFGQAFVKSCLQKFIDLFIGSKA